MDPRYAPLILIIRYDTSLAGILRGGIQRARPTSQTVTLHVVSLVVILSVHLANTTSGTQQKKKPMGCLIHLPEDAHRTIMMHMGRSAPHSLGLLNHAVDEFISPILLRKMCTPWRRYFPCESGVHAHPTPPGSFPTGRLHRHAKGVRVRRRISTPTPHAFLPNGSSIAYSSVLY